MEIIRDIFEKQYNAMRVVDLARIYNVSPQMIYHYIREFKIKMKGRAKKNTLKG